jgi:hypothetical protein
MIKTVVKVRGSTNDIRNKYSINSFYYSIENHIQRKFQSDDLSLIVHYKFLTWHINYLILVTSYF